MASSSVSVSLTFFPLKCICHLFPVSFSTVWILVIAGRWLGLVKSLLLCLLYLLEMIHPEAQSDLGSLIWHGHCVSQWFCVLPLGSTEHMTLRCWDCSEASGPARLTHRWWSSVCVFTCLLQQLAIFAHIHDFTGGCSPEMLWVCRAPSLSAGPSLQRETGPSTSGPLRDSLYRKYRECSILSFYLSLTEWWVGS